MADPALKWLTLTGLPTASLPAATATAAELTPLVTTLLQEALPLLDSVPTTTDNSTTSPWKSKGIKQHPHSTAPIAVTERRIAAETWVCRRSVHADAAARGSASWAEFARGLRDEHAAAEDAFTPTVVAHREARAWAGAAGVAVEGWGGITLVLVEMKHRVPPPLQPRVFAVLQLVARAVVGGGDVDEFVVVSVPVMDLVAEGGELAVLSRGKGIVVGSYAAVERVRRVGDGGEIEWVMATASDARGVLPIWVQTKVVPGQIAKDVDMFLGWIEGERKGTLGNGEGQGQAEEVKVVGEQQSGDGHVSATA